MGRYLRTGITFGQKWVRTLALIGLMLIIKSILIPPKIPFEPYNLPTLDKFYTDPNYIEDTKFIGNSSSDYGGVIDILGSADCITSTEPRIVGCNPSHGTFISPDFDLVIKNSIFDGNSSHRRAAISLAKIQLAQGFQKGNVYLENTTFRNNTTKSNLPSNGDIPYDEVETSIVVSGGDLEAKA
ncbi:hypothetical protein [Shewanella sp. UCD-KL21]|uniref:hypothetical protein n=1 Tax=Shewanella sp. UCD-KL21 TaxID=1917164 RepID=UPI0009706187|nr:hypothetical protein [Shewanella sp. UCD-KL21]